MATRTKKYRTILSESITDVQEWFEQFGYDLFEEGLGLVLRAELDAA